MHARLPQLVRSTLPAPTLFGNETRARDDAPRYRYRRSVIIPMTWYIIVNHWCFKLTPAEVIYTSWVGQSAYLASQASQAAHRFRTITAISHRLTPI